MNARDGSQRQPADAARTELQQAEAGAVTAEPAAGARREFGLRAPSRDPGLERLMGLGRWLDDDLSAAIALSGMTSSRIRELFPADQTDIRIIPCLSGLDLEADMADIFAASAALGSLQEDSDFAAFMAMVRPGAWVVDVGANFGLYAVHAALYAGPEGQVFAFEPGPAAFAILQANFARNGFEARGAAERAAVGAADGHAQFRLAADSAFSGLRDTGRSRTIGHIDVEVRALDHYQPLQGRAVDLIKIDTEGGEAEVLAGAHDLLARSPDVVVMFEFSHKNLDDQGRAALIEQLHELLATGLRLFARGPEGGAPIALQPQDLVGARSENLFLVRPESEAYPRFLAAMRQPGPQPTPQQATALDLLRRHGAHLHMHNDLCRNIVAAASKVMGVDLPPQPMLAMETLCRLLREKSAAAAGAARLQVSYDELRVAHTSALERMQARYDELRTAHAAATQRLDATFKSRDLHRQASAKLSAELTQAKADREQLSARVRALKQQVRALSEQVEDRVKL